jgi:hypothetical protein
MAFGIFFLQSEHFISLGQINRNTRRAISEKNPCWYMLIRTMSEDGLKPAQVRYSAPAIDRNPEHKWHYPTPLGPVTQQADKSSTEASTTGFQPPLRRGVRLAGIIGTSCPL